MAEVEKSGVIFRVLAAISPVTWNKVSFWTKAKDVEFDDSDVDASMTSLQSRVGSIAGITSDTSSTSDSVAASAAMVNGYNNDCAVQISSTDWSNSTTSVNGTNYYTCTKTFTKVWTPCPIVILSTMTSGQIIPTSAESAQFNKVAHIVGDTTANTITLYSTEQITVNLKLIVKGVVS